MSVPVAPKMKDVAARCGVSESTVSHVLNGTKFVSAKTREKVERVLRAMNFHRDAHARRLARGHSNFLGLIISDIENPFYPGLIKAFETGALEHGFEMLLCTTSYDPARTDQAFHKMIENKSPGVAVMTSRVRPENAQLLADYGIAAVFLDADGAGPLKSNIRLDYARGAREAVHYLYNLGHRKFAFIAGPQNRPSHVAYREAMEAAVKSLGRPLKIIEGQNDVESGERAIQRMLTEASLPTAVLCSNDVTAMGALRTLLKCGLRVPEDVAVIGADNIPFSALSHPPLTTVRIPRERLGGLALELLREMLTERQTVGREVVMETELIIRGSTGIAPDGMPAGRAAGREKPARK
jgi:DNA-binding LacI/PurR family transcriptional regulator